MQYFINTSIASTVNSLQATNFVIACSSTVSTGRFAEKSPIYCYIKFCSSSPEENYVGKSMKTVIFLNTALEIMKW